MIEKYIRAEVSEDIKRICKRKYKKGPFDFSRKWKEEYNKVWALEYREVYIWLEENSEPGLIKCQRCGKDQVYIVCPDYCVECHEIEERGGVPINGNHL